MPEYLIILLGLLLFTIFLHKYFQIKLFESGKQIIILYGVMYIMGITWDHIAISRGHWAFPGPGLTGIYIGLIPLEDYIFLLVCVYLSLVLYKVILKKFPK